MELKTFRKIFRDVNWAFSSKLGTALFNGLFVILLARALGVEGFGIYVGLISFINLLLPFLGLGSDSLLIKYISRGGGDIYRHLRKSFSYYLSSCLIIGISLAAVNELLFEIPFLLVILVGFVLAESFYRFSYVAGKVFQGMNDLKKASVVWTSVAAFKFMAVLIFWLQGFESIESWCYWYLSSGFIVTVIVWGISLVVISHNYTENGEGVNDRISIKEGLSFSFSETLAKTYSDVDKFMLLKLASNQAAGIYGGAYHFIKLANIPVQSLLSTIYADFFIKGASGFSKIYTFLKQVFPFVLLISCFFSALLYAGAPLIPVILGEGYSEAVEIVRWLAVVPVLQAMYMVQADAFSGSNHQGLRVKIQGVAVLFNILANVILIPLYGWKGAVIATLLSELLMTITFSIMTFRLRKLTGKTG